MAGGNGLALEGRMSVRISSPLAPTLSAQPSPPWCLLLWLTTGAVLAGTVFVLFGSSVIAVVKSFDKPEFSHGYIIPLISAWIVWQRRQLVWSFRQRGAWTGVLLVAVAVTVALVSHAAGVVTAPYLGLLLLLVGLLAATIGWPAARLLLVPIAFLVLTYPIPPTFYIQLSKALQLVSSKIGAANLDALGIPVYLDGNIIDLGVMKLQVAEACSGLRYLLPLFSFGVLCAFLYRASLWAKVVVMALTVPLAIALNGLRIALTGVFVHVGSQELAEGFMHLFEGWVIFLLAIAILFAAMFVILRLTGWRGSIADMLDFDRMAGTLVDRPPATLPVVPATPSRPLLFTIVPLAFAAVLVASVGQPTPVIPARPGLSLFPNTLGEWHAEARFLDLETEAILRADDYLLLDFHDRNKSAMVNLWVDYNGAMAKTQYHVPTNCLPAAGWEFVGLAPQATGITDFSGKQLVVNRAIVAKETERIVMYFWMELRGRSVQRLGHVKFVNLWDFLHSRRGDGALVRIYTPLRPGEKPEAGDARLLAFLERAYPHLEPHVGR